MNRTVPAIATPLNRLHRWRDEWDEVSHLYDQPQPKEDLRIFDLRAIWGPIHRNRWLILGIVLVAVAIGAASVMFMPKMYRASTSIQIDQQVKKVLGTEDSGETGGSNNEATRALQTQIDVLKSRSLAEKVAIDLANRPDSRVLFSGLEDEGFDAATLSNPVAFRSVLSGYIQSGLEVSLPPETRVVQLSFKSSSPKVASTVANAVSEKFVRENLQRRMDASTYSLNFLSDQLASAKARLEASERQMIGYARSAQLIETGAAGAGAGSSAPSLTTSNLVQLNQAYATARSNRIQAQQRWQQAQSTPVMSLPEVLGNSTVQSLTQRRAELEAAYQQELQRRQAEHPAVQQAAAQIRELDRQIATVATSVRQSIADQYQVAAKQEQALQGNVGQLKGETFAEQGRGVRYNILKREVDGNRELYDALLQRYREVSAAAGLTNNNISIVDKAVPPTAPYSPNAMLNMAIAGFAGLMLALLLVFSKEAFNDSAKGPDDVSEKLRLQVFGTVPKVSSSQSPFSQLVDQSSVMAEAYHSVRASIELSFSDVLPTSLLITSGRPGEGTSTSALALALDFASSGEKVLLIDGNMRNPSLHDTLALPNLEGLSNLLVRQASLLQVIQITGYAGLDVIPSGPLPTNPAGLLGREVLRELLADCGRLYDRVIIDGPPVLGLADALRLASAAEATIFVVAANGGAINDTKSALQRLFDVRANVIGSILSKYDPRKAASGKAYPAEYYSYGQSAPGARVPLLPSASSRTKQRSEDDAASEDEKREDLEAV